MSEIAAAEPETSATDLMAKLMGDWSWRPEMQLKDEGYIWTAEQVTMLNRLRDLPDVTVVHTQGLPMLPLRGKHVRMQLLPLRPWSCAPYQGTAVMPPRIGPVVG